MCALTSSGSIRRTFELSFRRLEPFLMKKDEPEIMMGALKIRRHLDAGLEVLDGAVRIAGFPERIAQIEIAQGAFSRNFKHVAEKGHVVPPVT
jgi:hypothetical protein